MKTDSLGNPIDGEPTIGPRGIIAKNDSLTTNKLVELLTQAPMTRKQQLQGSLFRGVQRLALSDGFNINSCSKPSSDRTTFVE